jgi:hypothetical protein
MTSKLYYTAPSDEIFNEVKNACIELWKSKNAHPSYENEKVERIKDIGNIKDNVMFMVAMFDDGNMSLLAEKLSDEAREALRDRMIDGGNPSYLIPF